MTIFAAEHYSITDSGWWYHDINEVIWGSVAFAIVFAVFLWKGLAPIKRLMVRRSERIADQIAQAEAAKAAAAQELTALRASLGNADQDAERILAEARERAEVVKRDLIARAESDVEETKNRARIEIEASKSQTLADLREEIIAMTIVATEALVAANLDDSLRAELVDQYIDQVGASQ
jgi:F-type H+-transporting ATPase subunit b